MSLWAGGRKTSDEILLLWGTVGFLTTALLDPLLYSMLDKPIPWGRDLMMGAAGVGCFYLLVKFRNDL